MAERPGTNKAANVMPYALVLCESVPLDTPYKGEHSDYAEALCAELGKFFYTPEPVRRGCDIWKHLITAIPDVIVISLTLPDANAISLVNSLRRMSYSTDIRFFLCCPKMDRSIERITETEGFDGAAAFGDDIAQTAMCVYTKYSEYARNKADNSLRSLRSFIDNNFNFYDSAFKNSLQNVLIEAILTPLGFDPSLRGTKYLESIITMQFLGAPDRLDLLYSCIAETYKTSPCAVEKTIRYAIERAWEKGSPYLQFSLFGNSIDASRGKPTNKEFIKTAVQHMRDKLLGNT